jgi:AbrB family looped-hinge helix DNA binding protein
MAITARRAKPLRSRITSQGQITVPKAVRDQMGAKPGDVLEFEQRSDGFMLYHRPRRNILDFAGLAGGSGQAFPTTAEAIDDMLEQIRIKAALVRDQRLQEAEGARTKGKGR